MPFQRVPATAEFRVLQKITTAGALPVDMINTIYLKTVAAPWTGATLATAGLDVKNEWNLYVRPHQSASVGIVEVQARDLDQEFGASATILAGTTGGNVSLTSATSLAFGIKIVGQGGFAPRFGKLYIPGVPETSISNNVIDESVRTTLRTDVQAFFTNITTIDYKPVIVSRYQSTLVTPENPQGKRLVAVTNEVESIVARSVVWSQRDRRPAPLSG
jgi:hypothetical protein